MLMQMVLARGESYGINRIKFNVTTILKISSLEHHMWRTKMWSKFFPLHYVHAHSLVASLTPNWTLFKNYSLRCVFQIFALHLHWQENSLGFLRKRSATKTFNQVCCAAQFKNSAHIFTVSHKYSTCGQ